MRGDSEKYSSDKEFIPMMMGLGGVSEGMVRVVLKPSFHPEEVWDIDSVGNLTLTRAKESIWYSIPQLVMIGGSKKWEYVSDANFKSDDVNSCYLGFIGVTSDEIIKSVLAYENPSSACVDGLGLVISYIHRGKLNHFTVHPPRKGTDLYSQLIALFTRLDTLGQKSDSQKYLRMA